MREWIYSFLIACGFLAAITVIILFMHYIMSVFFSNAPEGILFLIIFFVVVAFPIIVCIIKNVFFDN